MKFFFLFACSMMMFALCGFEAGPDGALEERWNFRRLADRRSRMESSLYRNPGKFQEDRLFSGDMKVDGKNDPLSDENENHADGRIEFSTSLSSRSFPEIGHASYQLSLSFDKFPPSDSGWERPADDPFLCQSAGGGVSGKPHRLTIEMVDATYHLDGNFSLFIQDDRKWGETISIRMNGRNHLRSGSLGIAVMVRKEPVVSVPVSLHQAANGASGMRRPATGSADGPIRDRIMICANSKREL